MKPEIFMIDSNYLANNFSMHTHMNKIPYIVVFYKK